MTKFNKGDKVRYNNPSNEAWHGVEGIVETPAGYEWGNLVVRLTIGATGWASNKTAGTATRIGSQYLELIEAPTFKVGDKVVVEKDYPGNTWHNVEGIVTGVRGTRGHRVKVTKQGPNNKYVEVGKEYTLTDLTVIPPFTYADIQKGDTIRRTATFKGGATEVREGTVNKKGSYYWRTEDNYILAYDTDDAPKDVTLELVNRPEPEPVKEAWETAKAGDRLVVKNAQGIIRVLTKQADGDWGTLLIREDGHSWLGCSRGDKAVKGQLSNSDFSVGEPQFIKA